MDESSDFHEKKDFTKLKKLPKSNNNPKKKPVKRIRGQKDIRTALKPKKNDLISYTKEFDKVCKKSGIDVDSEQLQLAVALSKSLNHPVDSLDACCSTQSLNTKNNINKIRTTLQEYGFTVPEIKIEKSVNKKLKKQQYKLLTTNDVEKKQIILDRYNQIISEKSNSITVLTADPDSECAEAKLLQLATNTSYNCLRNIEIFYIKGLLEISPNTVGYLLKDWSTIPGRAVSPTPELKPRFNLNDFIFTQCELDTFLSGTLEATQSLIRSTTKKFEIETTNESKKVLKSVNMKAIDEETIQNSCVEHEERCSSPDIFDDEVSLILDKSANKTTKEITIKDNNFMDLTDCVPAIKNSMIHLVNKTVCSQGSNVTKRKSNDLMEITNCIASSSQPIILNHHNPITINHSELECYQEQQNKVENIDLTQDDSIIQVHNDYMVKKVTIESENKNQEEIIEENDFIHEFNLDKQKSIQTVGKGKVENIDLKQDSSFVRAHSSETNKQIENSIENFDLTQSSDSCELPAINFNNSQKDHHEATIILDESEYTKLNNPRKYSTTNNENENNVGPNDIMTVYSDADEILDLTLEIQKSPSIQPIDGKNIKELEMTEDENILSYFNMNKSQSNSEVEIDLTQSLEASNDDDSNVKSQNATTSYSSLGKCDNMSLVYDEISNINHNSIASMSKSLDLRVSHCANEKDKFDDSVKENSEASSNKLDSSQASEVFEIYDNELNYSIQKSRLEMPSAHFELGGLSILDNVSKCSSNYIDVSKRQQDESVIDFKEVNAEIGKEDIISTIVSDNEYRPSKPLKITSEVAMQTPKTDYIIKTNQVTPMLDYSSMDTPDRNKELEKYGLKPFKRKRAIQLLQHLYNQTHPLIENIATEELPSPCKKLKSIPTKTHSPKQSPTKISNWPKKKSLRAQEQKSYNRGNLYEVTKEMPAIRDNIVCDPEDYVFQKREKAKVYSCKLPLHIAFHNYVSCRNRLKEAILRYEPINIDDIHKDLVAMGYRYDPKDLLKFLDKKCITVKTADNNSRNNKK